MVQKQRPLQVHTGGTSATIARRGAPTEPLGGVLSISLPLSGDMRQTLENLLRVTVTITSFSIVIRWVINELIAL